MLNLNKVMIVGRLVDDAELKQAGNTNVLEFTVANNQKFGEKEITNFVDCSMFGDRAAKLMPHLKKATVLYVEGSLRQDRWEKDGQKRSKIYLVVDSVEFA